MQQKKGHQGRARGRCQAGSRQVGVMFRESTSASNRQ